jgi:hypothetical protein
LRIPPLSAQLLGLCDGQSSIREIMAQFSGGDSTSGKEEADQVCLYGLSLLEQSALIEFGALACQQARMAI